MDLYIYETCPFCIKVLKKADEMGIKDKLNLIDASEPENRDKLEELGGKVQVPFLVDGDTMMYESDDIIDYLEEKFSS